MKRLVSICIIAIFLIGCGEDSSPQNENVDLPNISTTKKDNQLLSKAIKRNGGGKEVSIDDSSDTSPNIDDSAISNDYSNSDLGEIEPTEFDKSLDSLAANIIYDTHYNKSDDTFLIRWKSVNDAKIGDTIYYSYDKTNWKEVEIDINSNSITTRLDVTSHFLK